MADDLDLVNLDEAKRAINMESTTAEQDDILARHVTAVSRLMDELVGPAVVRTVTAEIHGGGGESVWLRRNPVTSVTTVREAFGGTISTLTAVTFGGTGNGYRAEKLHRDPPLLSGRLRRVSGGTGLCWPCGAESVEVTYVAGRYATTAAVDARFKDACGAVLRRLWKREAGSWAQHPDFYQQEDGTVGSGFFKVALPVVSEMLPDEMQTHLGIA